LLYRLNLASRQQPYLKDSFEMTTSLKRGDIPQCPHSSIQPQHTQ
jgi:hypothetical protein